MRGASALQEMLAGIPDRPLGVIVIWEPVLMADIGPPVSSVLSLISDKRAIQFWDKDRSISKLLVQAAMDDRSLLRPGDEISPDTIVWDFVAVFSTESVW